MHCKTFPNDSVILYIGTEEPVRCKSMIQTPAHDDGRSPWCLDIVTPDTCKAAALMFVLYTFIIGTFAIQMR